jgi:hypothetical protein
VPATECDLPDADAPTRHAGNIDVPAPALAPAPVLVLAVGASGKGSKPLSRRSTAGKAVSTICRTELTYVTWPETEIETETETETQHGGA